MNAIAETLFDSVREVRYVAIYRGGELELNVRPGIESASSSESDRYEELLVNPALLTLLRQRGEIDCGGLDHVLIRYGNFFQLVYPVRDGHVSVAIDPQADPRNAVDVVRRVVREAGVAPGQR